MQAKVHEGSLGGSGPTWGRICETGRFEAASERIMESKTSPNLTLKPILRSEGF